MVDYTIRQRNASRVIQKIEEFIENDGLWRMSFYTKPEMLKNIKKKIYWRSGVQSWYSMTKIGVPEDVKREWYAVLGDYVTHCRSFSTYNDINQILDVEKDEKWNKFKDFEEIRLPIKPVIIYLVNHDMSRLKVIVMTRKEYDSLQDKLYAMSAKGIVEKEIQRLIKANPSYRSISKAGIMAIETKKKAQQRKAKYGF